MASNSPARKPPGPTLIACAFFFAFLLYATLANRCLYADGSFYLLEVLKAHNFAAIIGSRSFASYVFEWPVVIALKLGITSIPLLTLAFGLGCFSVWPVAMFLCYRMAPQHFWLVMFACAAGCLNTFFQAVGEHIVAHAFFWPVLFAIFFVRPLTPFAAASLLASAIILMRSYESMLFLGPLLVALLLWRIISSGEKLWQRAVLAGAVVFLLVSVYVARVGVKYPNVVNYTGFKKGFYQQLQHPTLTLELTCLWVLLMLASLAPPVAGFLRKRPGLILTTTLVLFWGALPFLAPNQLEPQKQYDCRFLDLLVPLALMPVAVVMAVKPNWLAARIPDLIRLSAMLLVAQSLWHASATWQWQSFIRDWKNRLAAESGPIFPTDFTGFNHPDMSWANPTVSLLIGPPQVQAMFMPDHVESWQPFDPFKPSTFPDLKSYGVNYTAYINVLKEKNLIHE